MTDWKLVPTDEMVRAGCRAVQAGANANSPMGVREIIKAALAAAPSADLTELRALKRYEIESVWDGGNGATVCAHADPNGEWIRADELEALIERIDHI